MDFKAASDRLIDCVSLSDIATAVGKSDAMIRRARLDPSTDSYRSPPDGWERAIAKLATERAAELARLANELRRAR
jgi:hypothetical protein